MLINVSSSVIKIVTFELGLGQIQLLGKGGLGLMEKHSKALSWKRT